ncbi:hypothetical protein ACOSQ3_027776 [Xanthoceras sorbifolium]
MLFSSIAPDFLTFPFLLKECTRRFDGLVGSSIHGQAIKFGLYDDFFVRNSMISLCMACGFIARAKKLLDEMFSRDVISWNTIIGHLRSGDLGEALDLFRRMKRMNSSSDDDVVKPDKITIASELSACAYLGAIDHGNWVHGYMKRSGIDCDVVIETELVDM